MPVKFSWLTPYHSVRDADFDAPNDSPENACFCTRKKRKDWCSKYNGIFDIGPCSDEAPVYISLPHFYKTNPDVSQLVQGLQPDPKLHETWLDIEPYTGVPLFATKKLQISFRVEQIPQLAGFASIRHAFIPLVWVTEEGGVNEELADEIKAKLEPVGLATVGLAYAMLGSLAVFLLTLLLYMCCKCCSSSKVVSEIIAM